MSSEFYPIITIQPEWILEPEALGSKEKFWYRPPQESTKYDWLFKYPQENTGQHWAEKIAAEIAASLEIVHAPVEFAVFDAVQGSATKSFRHDGSNLFHGNQILAGQVLGYDDRKEFQQSQHTLVNIFIALEKTFLKPDKAKTRFLDYIMLDAIIGNTDRHHENWGILLKRKENTWIGNMAPTFDHASSLGRELIDEGVGKTRRRILKEKRVAKYSENGRGAIYWSASDKHGLSPLELVRRASQKYTNLFNKNTLTKLRQLNKDRIAGIVSKVPAGWMSEVAREFTIDLICYNLSELLRLKYD